MSSRLAAAALGGLAEVERLRQVAQSGFDSDRQRAGRPQALDHGASTSGAIDGVVRHLIDELHNDL
ncbi:hypothetical protein [Dinoroseobacter sp. S124A]|uniref:hypothetical protein n=1 Tax=Dinoroseobacter sp. S124A TaxID=3415128 RepID=UPI003C7E94DF